MTEELLAKSDPKRTLLHHTLDVLAMAIQYAKRWGHLAKLAGDETLFDDLALAALLHDVGKAASGFQAILNGQKDDTWLHYRHEILSGALVATLPASERQQDLLLAVMTHHLGWNDNLAARRSLRDYDSTYDRLVPFSERLMQLEHYWNDLKALLDKLKGYVTATTLWPNELPASPRDLPNPFEQIKAALQIKRGRRSRNSNVSSKKLALRRIYLRGLLISADHLASAAVTEDNADQAHIVPTLPRLRPTTSGTFSFNLNAHQRACAETKGSVLLTAPTGSGKTEAALLWAQANQSLDNARHLFYMLPFTASINAMYHRLKDKHFGEDAVSLLHGRSSYFLYRWLCEQELDRKLAAKQAKALRKQTKELYHPVKVLTPHQILMAFLGGKGWEKSFCEYSGGLFILDEVHAYEPKLMGLLFEILRRLTQELSAEICVMSATFPTHLKNALKAYIGDVTEVQLESSERRRYSRHIVTVASGSIRDHLDVICDRLAAGNRVLVVCNTVAGAVACFNALKEYAKNPCLVHGRLIQRDRQEAEGRLANKQIPVDLLVGTQAIEVSLDIDFDVLYSDPAPLDALLQRFGRVNRKPLHLLETLDVDARYRLVVVCHEQYPDTPAIYDRDDAGKHLVARTLEVLPNGSILDESKLTELIDNVYDKEQLKPALTIAEQHAQHLRRVVDELTPGSEHASNEETLLDDLIDSIPIVPVGFLDEHQAYFREKRYFDVEDFVFNISKRRYHALKKQNRLHFEREPYSGQACLYGCFAYTNQIGPDFELYQAPPVRIF